MSNSIAVNKLDACVQAVRVLAIICFILLLALIHAHSKILNIPKDYNIWIPPDISQGGFANLNEPENIHILNYTLFVHQGLYEWEIDGQKEFPNSINRYRHYMSSEYGRTLRARAAKAGNSYRNRKRDLFFNLKKDGHWSVTRKGNGNWHVQLAVRVKDSIANNVIKDEYVKYSYIVGVTELSKKKNPFGLIVEGEFRDTVRIEQ